MNVGRSHHWLISIPVTDLGSSLLAALTSRFIVSLQGAPGNGPIALVAVEAFPAQNVAVPHHGRAERCLHRDGTALPSEERQQQHPESEHHPCDSGGCFSDNPRERKGRVGGRVSWSGCDGRVGGRVSRSGCDGRDDRRLGDIQNVDAQIPGVVYLAGVEADIDGSTGHWVAVAVEMVRGRVLFRDHMGLRKRREIELDEIDPSREAGEQIPPARIGGGGGNRSARVRQVQVDDDVRNADLARILFPVDVTIEPDVIADLTQEILESGCATRGRRAGAGSRAGTA